MTNPSSGGKGLTALGKIISIVLVLGLVGLGGWIVWSKRNAKAAPGGGTGTPQSQARTGGGATRNGAAAADFDTSALTDMESKQPKIAPPSDYIPQNNTLDIELSEYAGYAGLIAANGGLDPSDNSYFNTKHGFKVRIKISESESWDALNSGKMAASATTADVLAIYGRQLRVIVPAQIGYSRGADGILVRNDIRKLNDLTGKTVALCQFTESDFLLRYLAREANIPVKMQSDLGTTDDSAINVVYTKDGPVAGTLFENAVKAKSTALAGAVTWAPSTTDIPARNSGSIKLLVSNRNLLLVADVLIVNRGFAEKNPKMVEGLVDGLLHGNEMVRDNPTANWEVVGKAFKWDRAKTLAELQKVHLSNLPEQTAFFSAGIAQGGSFANIFQSAVDLYTTDFKELKETPIDSDYFYRGDALKAAAASGAYKSQVAAIKPLESTTGSAERDPVLSKDIRFEFVALSHDLDPSKNDMNNTNLEAIKRILDISPGSHILLLGHADPTSTADARKNLSPDALQRVNNEAKQLSKDRAVEIYNQLIKRYNVDPKRLETVGMGYDKPVTMNMAEAARNRRVEVQWFTLE
ncbi:MAG TPA: phosphate ABC transporter substrate-binding/OmpA family protein [Phycisphaerae bacterium]|nr:phosphate ABC transporter substrate-binding/OmpA family protein [Phycisphaerae bacterium]